MGALQVPSLQIGVFPVTFDEYDAYCLDQGLKPPADRGGWGRGRRPAINVSWNDAQNYCAWLNDVAGPGWRLPSEAEWEYAARAGTTGKYWFGDEVTSVEARFNDGSGKQGTVDVGSFTANPFGLHDVHGNVWEWVEDCWHGGYAGAPVDGSPWRSDDGGDCTLAVLRGGSWLSGPQVLRSADRDWDERELRIYFVGFRVARTLFVS